MYFSRGTIRRPFAITIAGLLGLLVLSTAAAPASACSCGGSAAMLWPAFGQAVPIDSPILLSVPPYTLSELPIVSDALGQTLAVDIIATREGSWLCENALLLLRPRLPWPENTNLSVAVPFLPELAGTFGFGTTGGTGFEAAPAGDLSWDYRHFTHRAYDESCIGLIPATAVVDIRTNSSQPLVVTLTIDALQTSTVVTAGQSTFALPTSTQENDCLVLTAVDLDGVQQFAEMRCRPDECRLGLSFADHEPLECLDWGPGDASEPSPAADPSGESGGGCATVVPVGLHPPSLLFLAALVLVRRRSGRGVCRPRIKLVRTRDPSRGS